LRHGEREDASSKPGKTLCSDAKAAIVRDKKAISFAAYSIAIASLAGLHCEQSAARAISMLRRVQVSGFKSLEGFDLEFRKGINVVIGPNGSGKTNIINFIEFISLLSRETLLAAVSRGGGAGRIFRRDRSGNLARKISFVIRGEGRFFEAIPKPAEKTFYEFSADIVLSESNSDLFFSRQRIKLRTESDGAPDLFQQPEWPLDIEVTSDDEKSTNVRFYNAEAGYIVDRFSPKQEDPSKLRQTIEALAVEYSRGRAIFQFFDQYVKNCRVITIDLFGAKSFNIVPSIVRNPEDIAGEAGINEDGSGLAATLFALQNAPDEGIFYPYFLRTSFRDPQNTINKILSYSQIVNESILKIEVNPNTIENKLRIVVYVDYDKSVLKLPY
jgi:predicted ATPase